MGPGSPAIYAAYFEIVVDGETVFQAELLKDQTKSLGIDGIDLTGKDRLRIESYCANSDDPTEQVWGDLRLLK